MEGWQREYWQAAGVPDPDMLIGKRITFEPDRNNWWVQALQKRGYPISEVRGAIVAHETQSRSDAHADYTRLVLVIKVASGADVTYAEIAMDADSLSSLSDERARKWMFRDGLTQEEMSPRGRCLERISGALTITET